MSGVEPGSSLAGHRRCWGRRSGRARARRPRRRWRRRGSRRGSCAGSLAQQDLGGCGAIDLGVDGGAVDTSGAARPRRWRRRSVSAVASRSQHRVALGVRTSADRAHAEAARRPGRAGGRARCWATSAPSENPTTWAPVGDVPCGDAPARPARSTSFGTAHAGAVTQEVRTTHVVRRLEDRRPPAPTRCGRGPLRGGGPATGRSLAHRCVTARSRGGEALLRSALGGGGERDHDLAGVGGVGDAHLEGLVVRADGRVGDVLERDVEERRPPARASRPRQQRGGRRRRCGSGRRT